MLRLRVALAIVPLLGACGKEAPDFKPYAHPVAKPGGADVTCEKLSHSEDARWSPALLRLRLAAGSKLAVADASVLGGPFEPPLTIEAPPGDITVRVVLGTTRGGEGRPLCVELRWKEGRAASFRPLGDVAIDSDLLAIVDDQRYAAIVRPLSGQTFAGFEADANAMPALVKAVAIHDVPVEMLLPTYARATRPMKPGDRAIIDAALQEAHSPGRYLPDPGMPAYPFLHALGEKPAAAVDIGGANDAAIAVESTNGDGAYLAAIGLDEAGAPLLAEIRLSP